MQNIERRQNSNLIFMGGTRTGKSHSMYTAKDGTSALEKSILEVLKDSDLRIHQFEVSEFYKENMYDLMD